MLITVGVLVVLGGAGAAAAVELSKHHGGSASKIQVAGTFTLEDPTGFLRDGDGSPGSGCFGIGGYGDITAGAEVVISDDTGKTLVITSLSAGTIADDGCQFGFSAAVPAGRHFYGITVSHRGTVKEPEANLKDVSLTLGN